MYTAVYAIDVHADGLNFDLRTSLARVRRPRGTKVYTAVCVHTHSFRLAIYCSLARQVLRSASIYIKESSRILEGSYCVTDVHVSGRFFSSNFGTIATKSADLGQTSPNLTTDGLSTIRAGIFTSI